MHFEDFISYEKGGWLCFWKLEYIFLSDRKNFFTTPLISNFPFILSADCYELDFIYVNEKIVSAKVSWGKTLKRARVCASSSVWVKNVVEKAVDCA